MDSIILNYVLGNDLLYPTLAMPTKHGTSPSNLETNSNSNIDNKLLELKLTEIIGSNSKISFTTSNRDGLLEFENMLFEKPQ